MGSLFIVGVEAVRSAVWGCGTHTERRTSQFDLKVN